MRSVCYTSGMDWSLLAILGGGAAVLAWQRRNDRQHRDERELTTGLAPASDLTHLPSGLSGTALWTLSDGGFESRVLRGTLSQGIVDTEITAFDLLTLRERRGEWAFLPVQRPFRIRGVVTVVVCELPGPMPHLLCKRDGRGDDLAPDDRLERESSLAKSARSRLGLPHHHPAELPPGLRGALAPTTVAQSWRAYVGDEVHYALLLRAGLREALAGVQLRDLVIEVVDHVLVAYPATRDALSNDGFTELCHAAVRVTAAIKSAHETSPSGRDATQRQPL